MDNANSTALLLESKKKTLNSVFHVIVTIIFWPWAIVWVAMGTSVYLHNKRIDGLINAALGLDSNAYCVNDWV